MLNILIWNISFIFIKKSFTTKINVTEWIGNFLTWLFVFLSDYFQFVRQPRLECILILEHDQWTSGVYFKSQQICVLLSTHDPKEAWALISNYGQKKKIFSKRFWSKFLFIKNFFYHHVFWPTILFLTKSFFPEFFHQEFFSSKFFYQLFWGQQFSRLKFFYQQFLPTFRVGGWVIQIPN